MGFLEDLLEWGGMKKNIAFLIVSGIALVLSIFKVLPMLPFDIAWVAIILCGLPIIMEAVIGLVTRFDIKADVLVSMALIASVIIHQDFAAGEVAFIMQLGALLEDLTVARAQSGIEKLVRLTPQIAHILEDGKEKTIPASKVKVGMHLKVFPGETIPVDGVIVSGHSSINQAVMTGESLPVDKQTGDEVSSGTVNQFGAFEMEATRVGEDSSIQRMIRLVQSADAGKAKIVGMADSWATWVVITALSAAIITWLVTGKPIRAVTILVVFCPCSLVLATPTAIMAAIGNATKHGFLVREGDALERLSKVSKITFDKTGTLTLGIPEVETIESIDDHYTKEELLYFAAMAEVNSEHPLGKAIVRYYSKQSKKTLEAPKDFKMMPGLGVMVTIEDKKILAGNIRMMHEHHIDISTSKERAQKYLENGSTVIYLCVNDHPSAIISLADMLRENVSDIMRKLHRLNVIPVLLTGDNEKAAHHIGESVDIHTIKANCLPEDKLNYIEEMQMNGDEVCMVGDGVNDAPALKKAYVGIAMGGIGSDIAVDAADIVLVDDEVKELPHLFMLSKHMMRKIKFNLSFSMALNFIAIVLAITGILNPVIGALVHNSGSVFVIINSSLLLGYKKEL